MISLDIVFHIKSRLLLILLSGFLLSKTSNADKFLELRLTSGFFRPIPTYYIQPVSINKREKTRNEIVRNINLKLVEIKT